MSSTVANEQREIKVKSIVKSNVLWAAGAGLIPIPLADVFALTTVQVKMLAELSDVYGVPYTQDSAKSLIASLLSSSAAAALTYSTGSSIKSIPVVGQTVGVVSTSIYGGALTYAVGHLFINHFENGGTLLDFDVSKMKNSLAEFYEKGRSKITNWRSKSAKNSAEKEPVEQTGKES